MSIKTLSLSVWYSFWLPGVQEYLLHFFKWHFSHSLFSILSSNIGLSPPLISIYPMCCCTTGNDKNITLLVNHKDFFFNWHFVFHCFTFCFSLVYNSRQFYITTVSFTAIFSTLNNIWQSNCKTFCNSLQYAGYLKKYCFSICIES